MSTWRVTVRFSPTDEGITYTAIGRRDALVDAAYDNGALGVAIFEEKLG